MTSLPDVYRAELTTEELDVVLRDIRDGASVIGTSIRRAARAMISSEEPSLDQIRTLLTSGVIEGFQIRYEHDGTAWIDTVRVQDNGSYALTRIRHGG